jgi:nucleoid-associated protein YgaU
MKRKLTILALVFAAAFPLFAQEPDRMDGAGDETVPDSIRNNRYFLESLRYASLARLAMTEGDYDTVEEYSNEAIRWAVLSDEYVRAFLASRKPGLPAQYTVRTWKGEKDCLWNIAGKPWAYNNPYRWRVLYDANKDKFPDPKNPNWLEPGIVLDIPSIKGESRRGMWSQDKTYETFK